MKTLVLAFFITLSVMFANADIPNTDADWNKLLEAISLVESNGKTNIKTLDVNNHYSYGCLQIQQTYLFDSKLNYSVEDLYDKEISFEVAKAYLKRYAKSYEKRTGLKATYEVLARIHNGGPRGAEKKSTEKYWNKVKKYL